MASSGPLLLAAGLSPEPFPVSAIRLSSGNLPPAFGRRMTISDGNPNLNQIAVASCLKPRLHYSAVGSFEEDDEELCAKNLKDYFEEAEEMIRSVGGGGPPRWFSPLECGARRHDSPLLLFLPGIDGVGLGLIRHHRKLGRIFDIWCLHIPVKDRTEFEDLVEMVVRTVKDARHLSPNRPTYLVGESLGACIALAVAASIPDADLVLILANPATSFGNSPLKTFVPVVKALPDELHVAAPYVLSSITGGPFKTLVSRWVEGLPLDQTIGKLYQDLVTTSGYHSVLADILERQTFIWKLQLLGSASTFVNARLCCVKAQTLVLSSGRDELLPSQDEGKRLRKILPKCKIRNLKTSGHFLFLEDGFDFVSMIKGTAFYRRGKLPNPIADYVPITISEFNKFNMAYRFYELLTGSVILSSKDDGEIVQGVGGIPSKGPVLFVGNHMLLGSDLLSMPGLLFTERNIIVRGLAHPLMFSRFRDGWLPDVSVFDKFRMRGIVPVSAKNLHNLLKAKSHVLLYPGGMREAMHRKGEAYKVIWPENPEFVRFAVKFGAKIVPFGVIGEDDLFEEFLDYNDLAKIPFLKSFIEQLTSEGEILRSDSNEEVGRQEVYMPGFLPKFPGRFYYYYGKPIDTTVMALY